jgi:uncharacterized membrane protein YfcA
VFVIAVYNILLGATGGLLVLIFSIVLSPIQAIQAHAVISTVSSLSRSLFFFKHINWKLFWCLIASSIPGYLIGALLVSVANALYVGVIIGIYFLVLGFVSKEKVKKISRSHMFLTISFASLATVFVGGTGALVAPSVYGASRNRDEAIGTLSFFLIFHHLPKIFIFYSTMNSPENIRLLLLLSSFSILGNLCGKRLLRYVKPKITFSYVRIIGLIFAGYLILKPLKDLI